MSKTPFFVGCYTRVEGHVPNGCGDGIYSYLLDLESGNISCRSVESGMINPSYVHYDSATQQVFAVEEMDDAQGDLIAYDVQDDGSLKETSRQSTLGSATCHVTSSGGTVFVASYVSGSAAAYAISAGALAPGSNASYSGTGPNADRQEAPHAHQAAVSPDGNWLYVCDLGSDKLWCHAAQAPLAAPISSTTVPAGSGPRHLVFHPTLAKGYVICELTGNLLVCDYDAATGTLAITHEVSSLPADYTGAPSSAGIRMHPSGQAVYVANRGHDSIGIFPIDANGAVQGGSWLPCGGATPRDFAIDPTGSWLLVGNQDDSTITVFKIASPCCVDASSIQIYPCNTPTCIAFG